MTVFVSVHENEQLLQQHKESSFGLCFASRVMQEHPGVGCGESKSSKVTDSHRLRLLFKLQNRSNVFCLDWIRGVKAGRPKVNVRINVFVNKDACCVAETITASFLVQTNTNHT